MEKKKRKKENVVPAVAPTFLIPATLLLLEGSGPWPFLRALASYSPPGKYCSQNLFIHCKNSRLSWNLHLMSLSTGMAWKVGQEYINVQDQPHSIKTVLVFVSIALESKSLPTMRLSLLYRKAETAPQCDSRPTMRYRNSYLVNLVLLECGLQNLEIGHIFILVL